MPALEEQPYNRARLVTPSDTVDLVDGTSDALYVGGAGTVAVVFESGAAVSFTCAAAQVLRVAAKRVNATGTTATLMNALYIV